MAALLAVGSAGCGSESSDGAAPADRRRRLERQRGLWLATPASGAAAVPSGERSRTALTDNPVDQLFADPERNPATSSG